MPARATRVFDHTDDDLDAVLLMNGPSPDPSFSWATDCVHGGAFEGCAAVLRATGRPDVVVPPLEELSARRGAARVRVYRKRADFDRVLAGAVGDARRVGLDMERVSVNRLKRLKKLLPKARFHDAGPALAKARQIKDADELRRLARAARLISRLGDSIAERLRPGLTERALAAELVRDILAESQGPSFDPIVAFGRGSAEGHYQPGKVRIRRGPVLVDMGARVDGYCSDLTRTLHAGAPTKRFEAMYWAVHDALGAAIDAVGPGVAAKDVDAAARRRIDAAGFKGRFNHGTGHGLGVEIHDPGSLNQTSELVLKPGMVVTVEPGVYIPGFGGVRIEEDVLVTARGRRVLTRASTDLVCVGV